MQSLEEIKAFAEAEGVLEQLCPNETCLGTDCPACGGKGMVYIIHGVTWPPVAIEMMMADRARCEEIANVAHVAVQALHTARGGTDYRFVQQHLNVVNASLIQIYALATGSAD